VKVGLTTQDQILIEQRVANEAKSVGLAYILWFFFGLIGGHRLYLGYKTSGMAMLGLLVLALVTAAIVVGGAIFAGLCVWALVDAFLIPGMVQEQKNEIRRRLATDIQLSSVADIPVDTSKWSKSDREKLAQRIGRA
jgi:TM2 domain-containing membrane protein YozV